MRHPSRLISTASAAPYHDAAVLAALDHHGAVDHYPLMPFDTGARSVKGRSMMMVSLIAPGRLSARAYHPRSHSCSLLAAMPVILWQPAPETAPFLSHVFEHRRERRMFGCGCPRERPVDGGDAESEPVTRWMP